MTIRHRSRRLYTHLATSPSSFGTGKPWRARQEGETLLGLVLPGMQEQSVRSLEECVFGDSQDAGPKRSLLEGYETDGAPTVAVAQTSPVEIQLLSGGKAKPFR